MSVRLIPQPELRLCAEGPRAHDEAQANGCVSVPLNVKED